jgi:hypothetical protein
MWREMTTLADQKRYRLHRPVLKVRKIWENCHSWAILQDQGCPHFAWLTSPIS